MGFKVGDIITLGGTGVFADGVDCVVLEVHNEDGRILKMKAVTPDENLCKFGFFQEGEDYVVYEYNIITPN